MLFSPLFILLSFSLSAAAQSSLCPGGRAPDRVITAVNGIQYGVCQNTDFAGGDIASAGKVQSIEQLTEECSRLVGCLTATRIVSATEGWYKRTTSVGIVKIGCESIFRLNIVKKDNLCASDSAPSRIITTANGMRFGVCVGSDFRLGDISPDGVSNIASLEQLAEDCSKRPTCQASSLGKKNNVGWPKNTLNTVVANAAVDSVFKLNDPIAATSSRSTTPFTSSRASTISTSTPTTTSTSSKASAMSTTLSTSIISTITSTRPPQNTNLCPSNQGPSTIITTTNGMRFGVCLDTDFRLGDISNDPVPGITSLELLAEDCSKRPNCLGSARQKGIKAGWPKNVLNPGLANTAAEVVFKLLDPILSVGTSTASSSFTIRPSSTSISSNTISSTVQSSSASISISTSSTTPLPTVCAGARPPSRFITTQNKFMFGVCEGSDFRGGDATADGIGNIQTMEQLAEDCSKRLSCIGSSLSLRDRIGWPKNTLAPAEANGNVNSIVRISAGPPPNPSERAQTGQWGSVIQFPVIPVGIFMVSEKPRTTRLLAFSAFSPTVFSGPVSGLTQFAEYNLETGSMAQRSISNTQHDMFCPGISTLPDGRVVITGGSNAEKTSMYDSSSNGFMPGPNMRLGRGYQSSVTLSSGRIFTNGGSWSGQLGGKNGEIFDPATNAWTALPGALIQPSLTQDVEANKRDNHQWFFAWRNDSIFQAGPSKQMLWYWGSGTGRVQSQSIGIRDTEDAMCGVFAMYDALRGRIITAAGSPNYHESTPNKRAHHMTIGEPGTAPALERLPDLAFPRAFANAVVLPDGSVLITGGQTYSKAWTDTNSVLAPELFDPNTKTFRQLAPMKIPRNYHSTAILLPDGRVLTAGGGLCQNGGRCAAGSDHPDAEPFSPPYLFNQDGSEAKRPEIINLSSDSDTNGYSVRPGQKLILTLAEAQQGMTFSMVRIGTNTHSVNTDQRRVPLENIQQNANQYTLTLPNDSGILIPGDWYLFAMSAKGTPSLSRTVTVRR